jgi:hypothetical protein
MNTQKMFALGEVKAVEDAGGDPNGEFDVILSAPTLDRDGEVIDAKIFEPLPEHITFDIDHGMSTATTVGSGKPFYDGDVLRVKGTYSSIPRAQEVRTLVREGHIRTTSVAFMGAVREEKDGVPHIVKAELLNGAFVPIPSNRDALVLSAKAYNEKAAGQLLQEQRAPGDEDGSGDGDGEGDEVCAICGEPAEAHHDFTTTAPAAPDDDKSSGKPPASNVVAAARLRARHALDTV